MRLESRIKKAEDRLSSRDPNERLRRILRSIPPEKLRENFMNRPPEYAAKLILEASKRTGKNYDGFLNKFPQHFQEKVRAELEKLNAAGCQNQEN